LSIPSCVRLPVQRAAMHDNGGGRLMRTDRRQPMLILGGGMKTVPSALTRRSKREWRMSCVIWPDTCQAGERNLCAVAITDEKPRDTTHVQEVCHESVR
jgi:hypothetical protein